MGALTKAGLVRIEHVVNVYGSGGVTSLPIVVSDSRELLNDLLHGLGPQNTSPMEWDFSGKYEPFEASEYGSFNRAAGWRVYERLRARAGKRWRWQEANRTKQSESVSGGAGRVVIPIERLWMARHPAHPGPMEEKHLRQWGYRDEFGLFNCGLIAVDVSRLSGIQRDRSSCAADVVAHLLSRTDIWSHIQNREGLFLIQPRGALGDFVGQAPLSRFIWTYGRPDSVTFPSA